jgi:hypothetical protein
MEISAVSFQISLMENADHQQAANVLSTAMQNNPLHIGVFRGYGESERLETERMFIEMFKTSPGIVYLAKEKGKIIGVLRMKSCVGKNISQPIDPENINDIQWRKSVWFAEWAKHDPELAPANQYKPEGGLTPKEVIKINSLIGDWMPIAGATLSAYDPDADPEKRGLLAGLDLAEKISLLGTRK